MSETLKCPFCGGGGEPFNPFGDVEGTWCVLCSECGAATGFEQTEAEAIAAWNTRADSGSGICTIASTRYIESDIPDSWYEFDLSCGHTVKSEQVPPNYCEECGKRIDLQGVSYV